MDTQEFVEYVQKMYNQSPNGSFDRFGKEYIKNGNFNIRVEFLENTELNWAESYLGTGFGSCVDYGETYNQLNSGEMTEQELIEEVRKDIQRNPRQINFVHKENREVQAVYDGVVIIVKEDGYAIYPDPENKIEV